MNKAESRILLNVYDCLRKLDSLAPSNPADIQRLSKLSATVREVTPHLMDAISSARFGDMGEALEASLGAMERLGLKESSP